MRQPQRREDAGAPDAAEAADGAREELRHRVRIHHARRGRERSIRCCAPTTSPARCGFRATARPTRPISRNRWPRARACAARASSKACAVTGVDRRARQRRGRALRYRTATATKANSRCETSSTAAGNGRASSAGSPASTCRCSPPSISTSSPSRFAGVHPDLPVMRDPDGYIYYKEEVGGLVMGGFEPVAKPWNVPTIPEGFEFQLLPEDWDQFEILMPNAIHRTPCLETAEIKMLLNGPESFTLDGNFILGEAPELRRYFVCAGFNSAGIANAGGAGRLIAEWIVGGERAARPVGRRHPPLRALPCQPQASVRSHRRDAGPALRDALAARGAGDRAPAAPLAALRPAEGEGRGVRHQAQLGARQLFPAAGRRATAVHARHARLAALSCSRSSARVARTSSSSTRPRLPNSCSRAATRSPCCSACAPTTSTCPVDGMVYTAMLNERGGFESDLTITRLAIDTFFILTGSAQATRDADWIERAHRGRRIRRAGRRHQSAYSVISVMGPKVEALLARVSPDDLSEAGLSLRDDARNRRRLRARARGADELRRRPGLRALRADRSMRHALRRAVAAGADFGLERRRLLHHRRAAHRGRPPRVGRRARARRDAVGSRLGYAVKLDKRGTFIGRDALLAAARSRACKKRLLMFSFDDPAAFPWGGEPILMDGTQRRRAHVGRLQPQARPRAGDGLRAQRRRCSPTQRCSARAMRSISRARFSR